MVRNTPVHAFNDILVVVSGATTFDSWGNEQFTQQVVSSGVGRVEITDNRDIDSTGAIVMSKARAFVGPTFSGTIGNYVEANDQMFRINNIKIHKDGTGATRIKTLILEEVAQ